MQEQHSLHYIENFFIVNISGRIVLNIFFQILVHGRSCNWAGFPRWCPCCGAPTRQWAKLPPELWGTWCSSINLTSSKFSNVVALGRPCSCLRKLTPPRHKNKLQVGFFFPNLLTWSFTVLCQMFVFFAHIFGNKGLLWNLSSADELKGELIATALPALTESVLVPFTGWSESTATNNIHPDVFYNATGCLRWELC